VSADRLLLPIVILAACATAPSVAEARPASRGIVAEAGIGAAGFIGPDAGYAAIGPTLDLRIGYDLTSWFSLGLHTGASTHEATVPPPPEGEYFQLYVAQADGRLGFRLDRLAFFADGGAGVSYISSNILAKVDVLEPGERFSVTFSAGGGIEYQLLNRHYAFGLAGQWWLMPQFDALQGFTSRLYLRYTY
jgi:opacity protein-like surface antigen